MDQLLLFTKPARGLPVWVRCGLATAIVVLAFLLRLVAGGAMSGYPFLLFFPAIVIVSIMFDRGTGIYAVVLSTVLAWYFFVPVVHSFQLESLQAVVPLVLYVIIALFIALIVEALRATAERLAIARGQLEKAVELNRLLLMDVNHRVKNHLTSATALLRLTLRGAAAPDPRAVIEDAARRIDVLAKVYDRLHLGERATVISARDFIFGLCADLREGVIGDRPIALEVVADDTDLGSNQAVPIGLVINELVENAIKYAFPSDRPGQIHVLFECQGHHCILTVSDDGAGYDRGKTRQGGGARLIQAFSQQLGGSLEHGGPPGTRVRLRFEKVLDVIGDLHD